MNHTVYVEEYGRISLSCYSDIIMEMKNQSPNSEYEWLKNGFPVPNTRFYLQKLTLENALLSKLYVFSFFKLELPIKNNTGSYKHLNIL